jgi:hypothetical protein
MRRTNKRTEKKMAFSICHLIFGICHRTELIQRLSGIDLRGYLAMTNIKYQMADGKYCCPCLSCGARGVEPDLRE